VWKKLLVRRRSLSRRVHKIVFLVLVFSLMLSLVGISVPAAASAGTFRTTSRVNIRSEPNTDATAVTIVNSGTSVEVIDHNPAGWSKVTVGGSTGFIRSDFLRYPIASNSSATFKTTAGVNIRSSASTDSSKVATVEKGTSVEVTEHDPAGWSRVRVGSNRGFIRSDFLTRGGDGSAAGTEATGAAAASSPSSSGSSGSSGTSATLRTTGRVNLRSSPSSANNTNLVRTLAANTSVEVISTGHMDRENKPWSKVKIGNTEGYIRSDFLSTTGSSQSQTLKTTSSVNFRSGASTSNSVIRTIAANTNVEVLSTGHGDKGEWSNVRHNNTTGFIRSDFLSATGSSSRTLRTMTGVHMRTGPSTSNRSLGVLPVNTVVEVISTGHGTAGRWSKVKHNNNEGYIRSDFLGAGARRIEEIEWSDMRRLMPRNRDLRIYDVRTGISYNIRAFSLGNHADVDPSTQADTDAKLRTRNGVWAWTPRPVWVTVGDRTFAAAINGMPHAGSSVSGNGLNGHFCLHFRGSTSHGSTSASYVRNMQNAITEAYNARPR